MSNEDLNELIERARQAEMTPKQREQQRQSFAYGNTNIENERITKKMVADAAKKAPPKDPTGE